MADHKAIRSNPAAQPQSRRAKTARPGNPTTAASFNLNPNLNPQPRAGLMPVKASTYRALAELNAGFDRVLHDLGSLRQNSLFRSDVLSALYEQLGSVRARANREILSVLGERETANAGHFERLRWEGATSPPAGASPQVKQAGL
jgi:hypothetical protein